MTKEDIISAAFRVWGRQFYLRTSLSDLAAELGVTKAALYRHYRNKQGLLDEMYSVFFDEWADFIRSDFERAAAVPETLECLSFLVRGFIEFYARRRDYFIFSLIKVYGEPGEQGRFAMKEGLRLRGIDMSRLGRQGKGQSGEYPPPLQMIMATLFLWTASFHKSRCREEDGEPDEFLIRELVNSAENIVLRGLGFDHARVESLRFEALEDLAARRLRLEAPAAGIFKAVAEAVAEAGPWEVSMEMVARRLGFSKSSLYSHFKNKGDMIGRFFIAEFERILKYSKVGMELSDRLEEQLYLGIYSIADYLRSRQEILIACDWLRTRHLDLKPAEPPRLAQIFQGIDFRVGGRSIDFSFPDVERLGQWILFLIINTLMRKPGDLSFKDIPNSSFRTLYRFITLGVRGIKESSHDYTI
jgi:AcrR family transcriptional regulator